MKWTDFCLKSIMTGEVIWLLLQEYSGSSYWLNSSHLMQTCLLLSCMAIDAVKHEWREGRIYKYTNFIVLITANVIIVLRSIWYIRVAQITLASSSLILILFLTWSPAALISPVSFAFNSVKSGTRTWTLKPFKQSKSQGETVWAQHYEIP